MKVPAEPCKVCGCPVAWLRTTAAFCANCNEKPDGKWYRGLVVHNDDGSTKWVDFEKELAAHRASRDSAPGLQPQLATKSG